MKAICHDQLVAVSGEIQHASDWGCELVCISFASAPAFPRSAPVTLNLVNDRTGETQRVDAKLVSVRRAEKGWAYRIRWDHQPELLR